MAPKHNYEKRIHIKQDYKIYRIDSMQPVLAEYPFSPVHCYLRHFSCIILSADKMTYQTMHW